MEPTERFSNRVEHYVKYRPQYPTAVLDCLRAECGLTPESVIADVGSGTGLLSKLFLENRNPVFGVEPNDEMRAAGEKYLADYPRFTSVVGTAASTTLPSRSVDFVTAGQAAHWFHAEAAFVEFRRILRSPRTIAFVWNSRDVNATPFMQAYEQILLDFAVDDPAKAQRLGGHERKPQQILGDEIQSRTFANQQVLDFAGLKGRTLSTSTMPLPGHPHYEPLLNTLRQLFDAHEENGRITLLYVTELYFTRT